MEALLAPLGKKVKNYFGTQGAGPLPEDVALAVCTIEKANGLINRMLEEGRLQELAIIVIDELHMVNISVTAVVLCLSCLMPHATRHAFPCNRQANNPY